jgi:hypothetical protein
VPTHDEQRVRNTHCNRITCNGPICPGTVHHLDGAAGHVSGHDDGNRCVPVAIPGVGASWAGRLSLAGPSSSAHPTRSPPTAGAGNRTRCRPGSRRDDASGRERRSCSLLCGPPGADCAASATFGLMLAREPVPRRRAACPSSRTGRMLAPVSAGGMTNAAPRGISSAGERRVP